MAQPPQQPAAQAGQTTAAATGAAPFAANLPTPPKNRFQQGLGALLERFGALPMERKLVLLVSVAALIALFVVLVLWGRTPEYRVLFSNLSERDGGEVIAALQQMNVPYKTTEGGGAILVPADQVYDLRFKLASQGLPKGGAVGFELMDNAKLGMTQFQEHVAYQRALEGELARSIQSLSPVQRARVHLAIPKPSVFIRDKQLPSASVLVDLYPGRTLDKLQVSAIVHLVSSSVPELPPSQVTVVDQAGNLLTQKQDSAALRGLNPSQLDYLREIEAYYAQRIEAIIEPIVGPGNVRAEVRADLDFSESESTSESYGPNPTPQQQAVRSRQSVQDVNRSAAPGGVPGALTNQPPGLPGAPMVAPQDANAGAVQGQGQGTTSQRTEETVNYEVDRTIRHVRESLGRIKRLSVAVVVNYRKAAEGQPRTPLSPEELQQLNNLVREAMGYNQARGDTVNVVNAAFTEAEPLPEVPLWKDPDNVAFAKEILKNLLIFGLAFYLVFGVLRPILRDMLKPAPKAEEAAGGVFSAEAALDAFESKMEEMAQKSHVDRLQKVREFAKANPKVAADIIREWMAKE